MKAKVILAVLALLLAIPSTALASSPAVVPPHVMVGSVRVQVRMDHPHSLGACWPTPIKHFHLEVFRVLSTGRSEYMSNFHVGKSGACYVVFNNYKPAMCYKTCTGGSGLWASLKSAAKQLALAFGVTFTLVAIIAIATAAYAPALGM
jgi:hypothetical protein